MSIVTLKKLTASKYHNSTAGASDIPVFSINGTRRNQGYVGQDMRGRTILKTPMKGNVIRGHGGNFGTYIVAPVLQNQYTGGNLNDAMVVKSSVVGTGGMIMQKYRWIRRPAPFVSVKPDSNRNINSQSQLLNTIKNNAIQECETCENAKTSIVVCVKRPIGSGYNFNGNRFARYSVLGDAAKTKMLSNPQSEYIENKLHSVCVANDPPFVPTAVNRSPFINR